MVYGFGPESELVEKYYQAGRRETSSENGNKNINLKKKFTNPISLYNLFPREKTKSFNIVQCNGCLSNLMLSKVQMQLTQNPELGQTPTGLNSVPAYFFTCVQEKNCSYTVEIVYSKSN